MKGLSPVIATVLILLLAVGAVGGFWGWYQRQQSEIGGQSEDKLKEQLTQQAVTALSLASIYENDVGNISLIINNLASVEVNVTGFRMKEGTAASNVNTTLIQTLTAQASTVLDTIVSCTTGSTLKIQFFSQGVSTPEFTETCP